MLLPKLREEVLEANLELVRRGLVLYTFGNASGVDREQGLVVIKPSGVNYDELRPEHMVITDLHGTIVEGDLRPSSDLETHAVLYREFPQIGGVVHTHSEYATSFAQAGLPIPALGTTHADYFYGPVPVTEQLSDTAIEQQYVHETGLAIVARFRGGAEGADTYRSAAHLAPENGSGALSPEALSGIAVNGNSAHGTAASSQSRDIDPLAIPACLVAGHAPFAWGRTAREAAHNAVVLEAIARMAYRTLTLKAHADEVPQSLLDHHYFRKHGPNASYGQAR